MRLLAATIILSFFLLAGGNETTTGDGEVPPARCGDTMEGFRDYIEKGNSLYWENAFPQAADAYRSAFQVRRAVMVSQRGKAEAEEIATPDDFVMFGLALERMREEKSLRQAIDVLEEGKALFPNHMRIHYNLGVLRVGNSNAEEQAKALDEYERVLEVDPHHGDAMWNRAMILLHSGRPEAAAQSLEAEIPVALEKFGSAWYAKTPELIRMHEKLLVGVPPQPSRAQHLRDFVEEAFPLIYGDDWPEVLILEFGVADGSSIGVIARHVQLHKTDQVVDGFDSFLGLPERWASDSAGEYTQHGVPPYNIMPSNVKFHVGWFNETLQPFLAERPDRPVAALHLDADLYSSTMEVLDLLATRMPCGCVVRFDEYYLLRAKDAITAEQFDKHEARAWAEITTKYGIKAKPVSWHGQSVTFVVSENKSFREGNASAST